MKNTKVAVTTGKEIGSLNSLNRRAGSNAVFTRTKEDGSFDRWLLASEEDVILAHTGTGDEVLRTTTPAEGGIEVASSDGSFSRVLTEGGNDRASIKSSESNYELGVSEEGVDLKTSTGVTTGPIISLRDSSEVKISSIGWQGGSLDYLNRVEGAPTVFTQTLPGGATSNWLTCNNSGVSLTHPTTNEVVARTLSNSDGGLELDRVDGSFVDVATKDDISPASVSSPGVVELATRDETISGSSTSLVVSSY